MRVRHLIIMLLLWISLQAGGIIPVEARGSLDLEPYISEDGTFGLYKPRLWTVSATSYSNGRVISIADPGNTALATSMLFTLGARMDSVTYASQVFAEYSKRYPDFKLLWSRSTDDRSRTVVEIRYSDKSGIMRKGRYYITARYPDATVFGYEASENSFESLQPLLITILSNLTMLNPATYNEVVAEDPYAPYTFNMVGVCLGDGSASMYIPQGWRCTGEKGKIYCVSPDGGSAGFAFSTAEFIGPSSVPYFNSASVPGMLHYSYMAPIDALGIVLKLTGSGNIRVVSRSVNTAKARAIAASINRNADAETALLDYQIKNGTTCRGYFDAAALYPTYSGQWGLIYMGAWAPADQFDRYLPTLAIMAESFSINEAFSSQYIRNGAENLKRLAQQTVDKARQNSEEIQRSAMERWQEKARSQDYIDHKRSSTIRGEQEWITNVEGGTLYTSDHWGLTSGGNTVGEGEPFNYNNFNGDKPLFNTSLTPVDSSREIYEKVHGR